jgi:hypothetical protein
MTIESDAQGDLALDDEDAENVTGGNVTKGTTKAPSPVVGAEPVNPPNAGPSLQDLEGHFH